MGASDDLAVDDRRAYRGGRGAGTGGGEGVKVSSQVKDGRQARRWKSVIDHDELPDLFPGLAAVVGTVVEAQVARAEGERVRVRPDATDPEDVVRILEQAVTLCQTFERVRCALETLLIPRAQELRLDGRRLCRLRRDLKPQHAQRRSDQRLPLRLLASEALHVLRRAYRRWTDPSDMLGMNTPEDRGAFADATVDRRGRSLGQFRVPREDRRAVVFGVDEDAAAVVVDADVRRRLGPVVAPRRAFDGQVGLFRAGLAIVDEARERGASTGTGEERELAVFDDRNVGPVLKVDL